MAATPVVVAAATIMAASGESSPSTATRQQQQPAGAINTREIHKNGWLKMILSRERRTAPFGKSPKLEKVWVVFCIHDDVNAFLEYYDSRRSAFSHRPVKRISLSTCLHVTPSIVVNQEQEPDFVFCVALDGQMIKMSASSREQMTEWIDTLKNKLSEIGVLESRCNVYTRAPELSRLNLAANRDPTSPLPPPPVAPRPSIQSSIPRASSEPSSPSFHLSSMTGSSFAMPERNYLTTSQSHLTTTLNQQPSTSVISISTQQSLNSVRISTPPPVLQRRREQPSGVMDYIRSGLNAAATVINPSTISNIAQSTNENNNIIVDDDSGIIIERLNDYDYLAMVTYTAPNASLYEPIFLPTTTSADRINVIQGIRNPSYFIPPTQTIVSTPSLSPLLPPRSLPASLEWRSSTATTCDVNGNLSTTCLVNERNHLFSDENRRPLTLREKQTFHLCREINSRDGVRLLLPRKDCINTIAFVEFYGAVWIAGWKQREHPFLYHSFHIGDRVFKVGGQQVQSVQDVQKAIRAERSAKLEFIIARIPHGQVFSLKRETDGQDLGIIRNGNTAEIIEVVAGGLAFRCGFPLKAASCCDSSKMCNWVIIEINDRPLNLFFKDKEIHDRLNAVGKEISILVQPSDFVKSLKKQLKSIWSYKDFIVQ